ncbi:MAG: permease-like cell division protein FtsX [bacterium]|nr:permease-like cell division protein FtsX [bacterium]
MNQNDMLQMKNAITMPTDLANDLMQGCTAPRAKRPAFARASRLAFALAAALMIVVSGTTSFAYNIYQEKNLAVFMESDLSQTEIDRIGEELSLLSGVSSCRFVPGDEAWTKFSSAYLNEELTESFIENPLKDSFHYRLSVQLNADTKKVREEISRLEGVRLVQDLGELRE